VTTGGAGCATGGYGFGPDARNLTWPEVQTTTWTAGTVAEAAWAITANHGGGFSYRLCPKPAGGNAALTEACFQKTVLAAADDTHTVVFRNGSRATFPAVRTTEGTYPAGSQWTRNPIPACGGPGGGSLAASGDVCKGAQFPPPLGDYDELRGFGNDDHGGGLFYWYVLDRLKVPANLEPGSYVLSLRWDAEQTPQVWFTCADIKVVKASPPTPAQPYQCIHGQCVAASPGVSKDKCDLACHAPPSPPAGPTPAPAPAATCYAHCAQLGCKQGGGATCGDCLERNRHALQGECWGYPCPSNKCFANFRNVYC
jgi:hypothetical protein